MKAIRFALGPFLFMAFFAGVSQAQLQRAFVSGLGNDGNPCTRTAPCRTFSQAISQTNAGGEVYVLDTAGYGPFTINKAISIVAQGVTAGITVFSGDGIDINAGASDTIILRGLTVNSQGSGSGIVFNTGGTLRIESCSVNGFASGNHGGILFKGSGTLEVKDSTLTGNNGGIVVAPPSGTARAVIDNVQLTDSTIAGLFATDGSIVSVRNSVASGNSIGFYAASMAVAGVQLNLERCLATNNITFGIWAATNSTGATEINIESCVSSGNNPGGGGIGIFADAQVSTGPATVRLSNSMVTDNHTGLESDGAHATVLSRGNNTVEGNATPENAAGGGTITTYMAR
jgi:hypothetical protein